MVIAVKELNFADLRRQRWSQNAVAFRAPAKEHVSFEPGGILDALKNALRAAELPISGVVERLWEPFGLSVIIHGPTFSLCLHTWPEHGAATLDLSLAGNFTKSETVLNSFETDLRWHRFEDERHERGRGERM